MRIQQMWRILRINPDGSLAIAPPTDPLDPPDPQPKTAVQLSTVIQL